MSITQVLKYVRSTKGSVIYANEHFSAMYIPKYLIISLSDDEIIIPQTITITLEKEKSNA